MVILLARINTRIQALLWQGFGIPSKKRNGEKGKQDTEFAQQTLSKHSADTQPTSGNIAVVTEW